MPNDLRPKLGIDRTDHHWWIIQRKDALATSQLPEEACIHPDLQIVCIHSSLRRISAGCQVSSLFRHSTSKAWFCPGIQTNACWHNPKESHEPREALGSAKQRIPQQIHQSIRASRHLIRFLLQNISKYFYLDRLSDPLTCSYNLRPKNEFDLAQLRGRHACMRGRSLLTPLGQPLI